MNRKKMTKDGQLLCELQAETFERSVEKTGCSSEIFMRRFMKSSIVKQLDNGSILESNLRAQDIIDRIEEEYGASDYGSVKYTKNELYWIGYLYRYFAFTCGMTSGQVYGIVKPKELRGLYLAYHTMDPSQAIERILEAKGMLLNEEEELMRQYRIYKSIRNGDSETKYRNPARDLTV